MNLLKASDMVAAFMVALAGSHSIFDKSNRMKWVEHEYMPTDGILGNGHFFPYDVYKAAQNRQSTESNT